MSHATQRPYELYYWPTIQGRGEFVRLALEESGSAYIDVARAPEDKGGGVGPLMKLLRGDGEQLLPFAPPILRAGELVIAQTTNILAFLGSRHGLAPADEAGRLRTHQLDLTIADLAKEAHDTHHPIATGLYYEDQREEARKYTSFFVSERVPKFLGYFENVLRQSEGSEGRHLVGDSVTTADLSMFQVLSGLAYAFPKAMARIEREIPLLVALRDRVAARPRIAAYLASERRIPFNEKGLFRYYPELDLEPVGAGR